MRFPALPWSMFEILAGPAHLWLWIVARLCGGSFEHGPVDDEGDWISEE